MVSSVVLFAFRVSRVSMVWCLALLAYGCTSVDGKVPSSLMPDAAPPADSQSPYVEILDPVEHVPDELAYIGNGDLVLDGAPLGEHVIDTDSLTIDGVAYDVDDQGPVVFDWWWVDFGTLGYVPPLAILHVKSFSVTEGTTVRAIGRRSLVILAETITIDGILDASAHSQEGGAGGGSRAGGGYHLPNGFSIGMSGRKSGSYPYDHSRDGGGGGGALAQGGGHGGSSATSTEGDVGRGGAGGLPFEDIAHFPRLLGGSSGGSSSSHAFLVDEPMYCTAARGGAGGGAVLLYAMQALRIGPQGGINVGGGGGQGGVATDCGPGGDPTGGGGGGSGGTIYLQAPAVAIQGTLAANGGGGGGGAGSVLGQSGQPGEDGVLGIESASGGIAGGPGGAGGGRGGTRGFYPHLSPDGDGQIGEWNGGGGGGGVGLISIHIAADGAYESEQAVMSPEPYLDLYMSGQRE